MFPSINRFIILLISSNLFINAALGSIAPVLAVFVVDFIPGATIASVGAATGIFWLTKAILQMFVGKYLDVRQGERDDVVIMALGHVIMGLTPFFYLSIETVSGLYFIQFILAIGGALAVPPWFILFSRHLDKNKEGFEWSLNSSISFGIGSGISGLASGWIVEVFGFDTLFVIAGIVGILSAVILLPLYNYLRFTAPPGKSS